MRIIKNPAWVYYLADIDPHFDEVKVGKWMYFFGDRQFVEKICREAIEQNIVEECKHSNANDGVSCFYLNDDDIDGHRRVIEFFIKNDLIRKTKKASCTTYRSSTILRRLLVSMAMITIPVSNWKNS